MFCFSFRLGILFSDVTSRNDGIFRDKMAICSISNCNNLIKIEGSICIADTAEAFKFKWIFARIIVYLYTFSHRSENVKLAN